MDEKVSEIFNLLGLDKQSKQEIEIVKEEEIETMGDIMQKRAEMIIEEAKKRERMFENLHQGQTILVKKAKNSSKKQYSQITKLKIEANNGSCLICTLENGNIRTVNKAEVVSKLILLAVEKEFKNVKEVS